jgi:CheY-like chemotaxis protein
MGKRILLADDSITIQKVIELTFSDEDFEVVTVGNGRLAVEKVQEVRPDVVLCDIIMPEKDGYEVCEFIKKQPSLAQIPVLLLTGAFEPFDQERAARVGCDGFLAKPFEPQTLIAKVKDLLSQAAARPAAPPVASFAAPTAVPAPPPVVAAPQAPAEPSMTYIAEEPAIEAPMGFADVMDASPAVPAEALEEPMLDPDAFADLPAEPESAEDLLSVTPEERASLGSPVGAGDPGATVMFQPVTPPQWGLPPAQVQPAADEPEPVQPLTEAAAFEEVFEEDLSAPPPTLMDETPMPRLEDSAPLDEVPVASAAPFPSAPEAPPAPASFSPPPAEQFSTMPEPFVPPPATFVPPPPAPDIEDLAAPSLPSEAAEPSFAGLTPGDEPSAPSAAAAVSVPVDQVAQIAHSVVGQISEKVIREIAWEVVPELAEALIRKEIERLKAELQQV